MDDFDLYRLFKTLHVIAVVVLGGTFLLEGVVGAIVARARMVAEARAYARLLYISENYIGFPSALAVAIFGYLTIDRLNIDLDVTWLALGQVFFYVIVVLAVAFLRPAANRLYRLTQAAADGPVTPELRAQLSKPIAPIVGAIATVLFVLVIYFMVAKPAW
jgi:uncharacterized membrane protein